jgi:hypothetical protein
VASVEATVTRAWDSGESALVVVESDRDTNVAEHQRLARVVDEVLASVPPPD